MAINAKNSGTPRELVPAGVFFARCYMMVEIGTITETIPGQGEKTLHKVWIGWELPAEMREFKPGEGLKPMSINKEYTLSMNEKANLRKMLESWRGQGFTPEQAESFDITKLLGKPCMLNIIHKETASKNKYADIASVSPLPKGSEMPPQINGMFELGYDNFDARAFEVLPDFIKDKMKKSKEFQALQNPGHVGNHVDDASPNEEDDLPF